MAEQEAAKKNFQEVKSCLEYTGALMARGSSAVKELDFAQATDFYRRALEIRVAQFGRIAPQCRNAYYTYGCALLYKALQEKGDPLPGIMWGMSQQGYNKDGSTALQEKGDPMPGIVCGMSRQGYNKDGSTLKTCVNAVQGKAKEVEVESNADELCDGNEYESDLGLAWKMLHAAQAIVEKHSGGDTMEKVHVLAALAYVALKRGDFESASSQCMKAYTIWKTLVPAKRDMSKAVDICCGPEEAIPYCQKAISFYKSRVQQLVNEKKNLSGPNDIQADKEATINILTFVCGEFEKKLEDLQQQVLDKKFRLLSISPAAKTLSTTTAQL